jgi:hypothetical protein
VRVTGRPLGAAGLVLSYLPLIALLVILGFALGWGVPVAGALGLALLTRAARRSTHAAEIGNARTIAGLFGVALVASVIGGVLFGGLGVIFGFAGGFAVRLGRIPITFHRSARPDV